MENMKEKNIKRFDTVYRNIKNYNKEIMIYNSLMQYRELVQEYQTICFRYIYQDKVNQFAGQNNISDQYVRQEVEMVFFNMYSFFSNPYVFALNKNKEIYCIGKIEFSFNRDNYQSVFHKWGYYCPSEKFIDSLYQVLALRKEKGPYWKYINYKMINNCSDCVFERLEWFTFFEGNIFFTYDNKKELLHEKTYKIPVIVNNQAAKSGYCFSMLRQPNVRQFKAIMDLIKPFIESGNSLSIVKHNEQRCLQFIIHHLQKNYSLVKSIQINEEYIVQSNLKARLVKRNEVSNKCKGVSEKNTGNIPINFIRYLSMLDNEHLEVLDQLAITIARINLLKEKKDRMSKGIIPKITIILTANVEVIKKFFIDLYPTSIKLVNNISELCNKKKLTENILFKLNGGILQIAESSGRVKEEDLKILKKFVRSMSVSKIDNAVGSIKYISNCHYILLADKQEEVNVYQNYFNGLAEVIILKGKKVTELTTLSDEAKPLQLDEFDYHWIHTIFATYGLLLLTEEKGRTKKKETVLDIPEVVKDFIEECCTNNGDCYVDDLHLLYKHYFIKKYGIEPIKRIRLVNLLKLDGQYKYCQLRHSAKDYKWGFKGLSIKEDKINEYVKSQSDCQLTEKTVLEHIEKINEKVIPLLEVKKSEYNLEK